MDNLKNDPRLTPDFRERGTAPLTDAGPSEVAARVTYWLIVHDWRKNPTGYAHPTTGLRALAVSLRSYEDTFVRTCLTAAGEFLEGNKGTLKQWRDQIIYRSRYHMAARRAGRPWGKAPTPVLLTGGSVEDNLRTITGSDVIEPYRRERGGRRRAR